MPPKVSITIPGISGMKIISKFDKRRRQHMEHQATLPDLSKDFQEVLQGFSDLTDCIDSLIHRIDTLIAKIEEDENYE